MRGIFDSSGVTSPASDEPSGVGPKSASTPPFALLPDALVTDVAASLGVVEALIDGTTADIELTGSACTMACPSCAFFSFHHTPAATSAEATINTRTSKIPGR